MGNPLCTKISVFKTFLMHYSVMIILYFPHRKRKIQGGVKLFKNSEEYLSHEEPKDTYTNGHNFEAKRLEKKKRKIDDVEDLNDNGLFS